MKATLIQHCGNDEMVVRAARVSYAKDLPKGVLDDKDEKLIKYLADHSHLTPFEYCDATILIECPLPIRVHFLKHRTSTINEVSRRYTAENIEIFEVDFYRNQSKKSKQCSEGRHVRSDFWKKVHKKYADLGVLIYEKMIEDDVCKEQARFTLVQALNTRFYMKMNLRNWAHLLTLRLDKHSQEETRKIALQIYNILISLFPESMKYLVKKG